MTLQRFLLIFLLVITSRIGSINVTNLKENGIRLLLQESAKQKAHQKQKKFNLLKIIISLFLKSKKRQMLLFFSCKKMEGSTEDNNSPTNKFAMESTFWFLH